MYDKLFDILNDNFDQLITPKMLEDMGMKLITGYDDDATPECWWSDSFHGSYFSLRVEYNERVQDVVKTIIANDISSLEEDIAEQAAGADW